MKKKDARSLSQDTQEAIRIKAVKAVLRGKKQNETAEIFGVTPKAVNNWMKVYRKGGLRALRKGRKGRPVSESRLKGWQAAQIVKTVIDRTPEQLKLPFVLWTQKAVAELIEKRFGVSISRPTAGRWLRKWGLTAQKPVRRAYERNPQEVKKWLEEEYPRIRRSAKAEGARIYWGDQSGLRSDHQSGTTYGKRGITPVVAGTGKRFRCNVISAITNRGEMAFRVFRCSFKREVFVDFMKRLIRHAKRKVYLIVDRHPVHLSGKVNNWIEKNKRQIRAFYLPGYSPELNPDELVNQDLKKEMGRKRPRMQGELIKNARSHLWSRQRSPRTVRNFFKEEHVRYAAL